MYPKTMSTITKAAIGITFVHYKHFQMVEYLVPCKSSQIYHYLIVEVIAITTNSNP